MVAVAGGALLNGIGAPVLVKSLATLAFTYVDNQLMADAAKDEPSGDTDLLLGVPTGAQGPGSDTVWAIGRRIRVPCHVLYQSSKIREDVPSSKQSTGTIERQVWVDSLVSVNTRKTNRILQLIGNGRLLAWTERNLIRIETDGMYATWVGGSPTTIQIIMNSVFEVSFARLFKIGDLVELQGFEHTSSAVTQVLNRTVMRVSGVFDHSGVTPSSIQLELIRNQGAAISSAGTATAGTPQTPGAVIRRDDTVDVYQDTTLVTGGDPRIILRGPDLQRWRQLFNVGDHVRVIAMGTYDLSGRVFVIKSLDIFGPTQIMVIDRVSGPTIGFSGTFSNVGTAFNRCIIDLDASTKVASGFFEPDYDFPGSFYDGAEDQGQNPLLVLKKGSGNVSGYRGVAYQEIPQMNVTQLGGQLPQSIEAIIEVDNEATLRTAIRDVLLRADYVSGEFSFEELTDKPFLGMYVLGRLNAKTALQPLSLIYRFLTQERGSVLHFFDVANADIIELGPSDIGWTRSGDRPVAPIEFDDPQSQALPTSFGVKFQDPDLAYAQGYESFAVRNPSGLGYQKDDSVNLRNVVMRRRDARDMAANTIRLSWINIMTFQVTIGAYFLDVLENDIVKVSDEDGNIHVGRVLTRKLITDTYLIELLCTVEDLSDLPVNTGGDPIPPETLPPVVTPTAQLIYRVLDIPAMADNEIYVPGLKFICSSEIGSGWSGAVVYESFDGTTWTAAEYITTRSEMGETLSAFPQAASVAESLGSSSLNTETTYHLDIELSYIGPAGLSDATDAEAATGKNWFVIIQDSGVYEIFAAKTIVHLTGNQYRLSNFLRGIRGTWFTAKNQDHSTGTRIALLRNYSHREYSGTTPSTIYFKFVPAGGSIDAAETITFTPVWQNVLPFPPRVAIKTIGPGPQYDIKIETANWTRRLFPLGFTGPYPIDDLPEGYRIRLFNASNPVIIEFEDVLVGTAGSPTLRDRFTTFFNTDLSAAGYTPSGTLQIMIDIQQFNQYGFSASQKRLL